MKIKPNFIIVGVARCGTTSLFHYLEQHPEIGMAKVKEPKYFSSLDLTLPQNGIGDSTVFSKLIKDEASYDNLFEGLEGYKAVGEASSDYFYYHKTVIPRIKKKLGDIKIIVCLRDPVERAFSAYNNLIRDSREYLEFSKGLSEEESRINQNWDWMWHYKNGGLYSQALENYQKEFTNVKVILFEDLVFDTQNILKELFMFLDVRADVPIDFSTKYSISGKPKSSIISIFTSRNNPIIFLIREVLLKLIPRKYLEQLAGKLFRKELIEPKVKTYLKSFFNEDLLKLQSLLKKNIDNWL